LRQQSHDVLALPRSVAAFRGFFAEWRGGNETTNLGCSPKHFRSNVGSLQGLGISGTQR
jgi:hypothetical protein